MKTQKLFFLFMCIFCFLEVNAQNSTIKGIVKDGTSLKGVGYVTIALVKLDSALVTGCYTDTDGTFEIKNIADGDYILRASFVGYQTHDSKINLKANKVMDEILLREDNNMLNEITIEGKRPFIQQKIDRYVVSISDHLLTAGRNGFDILRYTPGLLVQNRSITMMGDNVDVWIDGRPSRMDANTLATYLEGLQGENIDQIEIITNPSSKFDAGGGRSIINIKMKKHKDMDVLNGSVNTAYELSKRHIGVGGIGLNYRKEKINIFGSYNIRGGNDISTIHELTTNKMATQQRTYDKSVKFDVDETVSHNYRAGIDFFPDKSNIIGVLFNGFNTNDDVNSNSTTMIEPLLENTYRSLMGGKYKTDVAGQMYNMNYKHLFDKEGVELVADVDYGHISNTQNQRQNYTFFSSEGNQSEPASSQRNRLPQMTNLWSAKVDYQHPISESMYWDAGMKASGTKTDNDIVYEQLVEGNWENDVNRSNYFKYIENIYAVYMNAGHQIKKWAYQVGLRTEYTYSKGNQLTTNQINKKKYWKIFPSAYLQYALNENHYWVLSYTRRIRRPDYQTLNPFEMILDNYSYIAGNPYLNPSYNNNIELKYTFRQKLSTTLNWTRNEKMILQEPVIDEINNRYGYVFNNFGSRTAYIFMINYNDSYFKFWRLNFMGQLAYIKNEARNSYANFDNDGMSAAIWMNNSFQIDKSISAEIGLLLLPSMRVGYTKSNKVNNNLSFGIRKNVLSDKGTLSLSANDILAGQVSRNTTNLDDIHIRTRENNNQRSFTLSFSYRFGSNKVKDARDRSIGIEEQIERAQTLKK